MSYIRNDPAGRAAWWVAIVLAVPLIPVYAVIRLLSDKWRTLRP